MPETRFSLIARVVVGGVLVCESLLLLIAGGFIAIIGGLATVLSFGVGGASATDEQLTEGAAIIGVTLAAPFALAVVVGVAGILLLLRRGRLGIVAAALFTLAAQFALHWVVDEGFYVADLAPGALHLSTIAVALASVPVTPVQRATP